MSSDVSFHTIDDVRRHFHRISTPTQFERAASVVEAYQKLNNPVFARYDAGRFVPIDVFKYTRIACFPLGETATVFRSSGTGHADRRAEHHIRDLEVYHRSARIGFEHAFGRRPYVLLAYVPAYADDSSLVWMLRYLTGEAGVEGSHILVDARRGILEAASRAVSGPPVLLFGAAFALMDLVEKDPVPLPPGSLVVETGGMKTHRRAMDRSQLHQALAEGFTLPIASIHSEYGMCEMLSQCYTAQSHGLHEAEGINDIFYAPPWVRLDVHRPDAVDEPAADGEEGVLVVTDLANMFSLSFIRTEDRAVRQGSGVAILGRQPGAPLRGCNFLFENDM